jgi:hypothetical protein
MVSTEQHVSIFKAFFILVLCVVAFFCGAIVMQVRVFPANAVSKVERTFLGRDLTANLNRDTLEKIYATRSRTKLLLIGDSHIQFGDWATLLGRDDVTAEGIAGENSEELLARLKARRPAGSIVFISTGTNDVGIISLAGSTANITDIVKFLVPDNKVYLIAPPTTSLAQRNAELNEIVSKEAVICKDLPCQIVDANPVIAPRGIRLPDTTVDGIHLTDKGYRALAELIKPLASGE